MKKLFFILIFSSLSVNMKAQSIKIINKTYNSNRCITSYGVEVNSTDNSLYLKVNNNKIPLVFNSNKAIVKIKDVSENIEIKLIKDIITDIWIFPVTNPITLMSINEYKCLNDFDLDNIPNNIDNCPNNSNENQSDIDNDGLGDSCDSKDNRDSDKDGVQNWQDKCPNQVGPSSNNGCPFADLIIDKKNSTTYSTGESGTTKTLDTNTSHSIYMGDNLQINLKIINVGDTNSGYTKVGFYLSTTNNIDNAKEIREIDLENLNQNDSQTKFINFTHSDLINAWGSDQVFLHIKIDNDNNVNEGTSGEQNNTFSRSLFIKNSVRRQSKFPSIITIHNSNGIKIEETTINNKTEEIKFLKELPKGLYFIDQNGKKSKIYKED